MQKRSYVIVLLIVLLLFAVNNTYATRSSDPRRAKRYRGTLDEREDRLDLLDDIEQLFGSLLKRKNRRKKYKSNVLSASGQQLTNPATFAPKPTIKPSNPKPKPPVPTKVVVKARAEVIPITTTVASNATTAVPVAVVGNQSDFSGLVKEHYAHFSSHCGTWCQVGVFGGTGLVVLVMVICCISIITYCIIKRRRANKKPYGSEYYNKLSDTVE